MDFDVKLMEETSQKITKRLLDDMHSIAKTHGAVFAKSAVSTAAIAIMAKVVATQKDSDDQLIVTVAMLIAFSDSLQSEMVSNEAREVIEKAMKQARSKA